MTIQIKDLRDEKNLSQEELAKKADVSRTIISDLENGKKNNITLNTLKKIAEALEVQVNDIFL